MAAWQDLHPRIGQASSAFARAFFFFFFFACGALYGRSLERAALLAELRVREEGFMSLRDLRGRRRSL